MNIEQLKEEEKELLLRIQQNREIQKGINTESFMRNIGCNIGDKISFKVGRDIVIGMIYSWEYDGPDIFGAVVHLYKSDGTLGKRIQRCYDTKSIKKV